MQNKDILLLILAHALLLVGMFEHCREVKKRPPYAFWRVYR